MDKKFYGLIIPKKTEKIQPKKKSVFDSDSDDDIQPPKRELKSLPTSSKVKAIEKKVLEDDPTIYEYDTIYDSLKEQKTQNRIEKVQKESRFINSLLKAADKRKKDHERRLEKKIQIDRSKEGDEFDDKEAFVTSAYKKKMEEMEKEEERERIKEQLEDMMDVTKQKDLSGFYRHYLKQAMGEEKVPEFDHETAKIDAVKKVPEEYDVRKDKFKKRKIEKSAQYRCRKESNSSSDEGEKGIPDRKAKSIQKLKRVCDQESYDKDEGNKTRRHSQSNEHFMLTSHTVSEGTVTSKNDVGKTSVQIAAHESLNMDEDEDMSDSDSGSEKATNYPTVAEDSANEIVQKSDKKSDISQKFKKRTVGDVFDHAQARYFKRMSLRGT